MKITKLLVALLTAAGCASNRSEAPDSFRVAEANFAPLQTQSAPLDGTLDTYLDSAVKGRPELRASLERWRGSVARIDTVDELPPLEVEYGFYARRVETRVGAQRHRVRVKQGVRWPSKTRRAKTVGRERARVDGERHSMELLDVRFEVADAFWRVWELAERERWHKEHEALLGLLVQTARVRVEVGGAALSDIGQADLALSRTVDARRQAAEERIRLSYRLSRAIGVSPNADLDAKTTAPSPRVPVDSDEEIVAVAEAQPDVRIWQARQRAKQAELAEIASRRYPDLGLAAEWVETGPALDPTVAGSGKDAVVGVVGLKLPLWDRETGAAERAAEADQARLKAEEDVARQRVGASVRITLNEIRDSAGRILLYRDTLLPQAEAVLGSVRGAYEVGQAGVAALLLAERELLELRLVLSAIQAKHERQWVVLERLVARPLATKEAK